jgi:hypothetical protein
MHMFIYSMSYTCVHYVQCDITLRSYQCSCISRPPRQWIALLNTNIVYIYTYQCVTQIIVNGCLPWTKHVIHSGIVKGAIPILRRSYTYNHDTTLESPGEVYIPTCTTCRWHIVLIRMYISVYDDVHGWYVQQFFKMISPVMSSPCKGLSHLCWSERGSVHVVHVPKYNKNVNMPWDPSQSRPDWLMIVYVCDVCATFIPPCVRSQVDQLIQTRFIVTFYTVLDTTMPFAARLSRS